MKIYHLMSISSWIRHIVVLILIIHPSYSQIGFKCQTDSKRGPKAPALPDAYSTNMRVNYIYDLYSMEVKYATIGKLHKEVFEFKTQTKHAKYITTGKDTPALVIEYRKDAHPTCRLTDSKKILEAVDSDFAGENRIFLKAAEVMMFPDAFDMYGVGPYTETGMFSLRYEGCISIPEVNVSMAFAAPKWKQARVSSRINASYPVIALAEIGPRQMTALYSNFDPTDPDEALFQPPEDVYCEGFRADKKPPSMPDAFSYNSEMIIYESSEGIAPYISFREVYYDYPASISRIDFYDTLSETSDLYSKVRSKRKSMIHDYNAGIQFLFDMDSGECMVDGLQVSPNVISIQETEGNKMYRGDKYFWLDDAKTSYNGQYFVNGKIADVYTALREDPKTKKRYITSWAFSTNETRIVESENVGKNALLRMYVRPETDMGFDGVIQVNFHKFSRREPEDSIFDITSCHNVSTSKTLILTFPTYETLKGTHKMIGTLVSQAIRRVTGLRKQRISVHEVIFSGNYIYAEFTLLEDSSVKGQTSDENSLDDALAKLRKAVSDGTFFVDVPDSMNQTISLTAEPDGLNVFSGDRSREPKQVGYKQGSVIGLAIGFLILGLGLGGIAVNFIILKKYGVSLFQKSGFGHTQFDNALNESSI